MIFNIFEWRKRARTAKMPKTPQNHVALPGPWSWSFLHDNWIHLSFLGCCRSDLRSWLSFWFQNVGKTLTPSLLTDFTWSLLMTLSSPNYVTALKASTILKLTLEYYAHKVTMVRYLTMSRGHGFYSLTLFSSCLSYMLLLFLCISCCYSVCRFDQMRGLFCKIFQAYRTFRK